MIFMEVFLMIIMSMTLSYTTKMHALMYIVHSTLVYLFTLFTIYIHYRPRIAHLSLTLFLVCKCTSLDWYRKFYSTFTTFVVDATYLWFEHPDPNLGDKTKHIALQSAHLPNLQRKVWFSKTENPNFSDILWQKVICAGVHYC